MATSGTATQRILAVDDNDLNLGLFRLFLTQLGHSVTAVNDPFSAIDIARQEAFDIIFTDIQMPGLTGIEASEAFRQDGFAGPIIAITAHLSPAEEANILSSAINGVLIKPVTKHDLTRVLATHLPAATEAGVRTPTATYEVHQSLNPALTNKPTYDLDVALSRANGSGELATETLGLLIESLAELKRVIDAPGDQQSVAQALHKFAGGVRFSGATALEAELEQVRDQTAEGLDFSGLLAKIAELEAWQQANPSPFTTPD
jgi:two-component system sensor histidine kinase BarA